MTSLLQIEPVSKMRIPSPPLSPRQNVLFCQQHHHRFSKSFMLTLAVGITFGFSFAYLLLSVVSWERVDFLGTSFFLQRRPHDPHDHHDLDSISGPSSPLSFHSIDEEFHKSKIYSFSLLNIVSIITRINYFVLFLELLKNSNFS